ncbi:MAG: tripartite tricarboxylate transporter TctB family protein [Tagaea sp.]|nr:tripartite tricarboxylate transporter TctB family protein [Tagaea sp.]
MSQEPESAGETRRDVAFAVAMIGAGLLTIWGLRNQPKAPFDPLGAAAIPVWTAWIVIALATLLLLRIALGKLTRGGAQSMFTSTEAVDSSYEVRPVLSWVAIGLSFAYAAAMPLLGFALASTIFMFAFGWALSDRSPRMTAIAAVVAVLGGFGLDAGFGAMSVALP